MLCKHYHESIPAMETDYDILIIGAGCAGLSLAMRLAERGERCPRIALIERRESYVHDRTWSFWGGQSAQLKPLVHREWKEVVVRGNNQLVQVDCRRMPYQSIQSGAFYESARALIAKNRRINFFAGESVENISKNKEKWEVSLRMGKVRGSQVVDTRPSEKGGGDIPLLWQSFSGVEVECQEDVFDENVATLMDFIAGRSDEISFLYLLPFSRRKALIEATVFGKTVRTQAQLTELLEHCLKRSMGSVPFKVIYREHFVIPMGLPDISRSEDESYVKVGLEHGGARASTGYVFQRIQRWADQAAVRVLRGESISGHQPDAWIIRKMDRLFLWVLRMHPERAAEIFVRLFSMRKPESVIRFMNDEATLIDLLKIVWVLPRGLFMKEMVRGIFR